MPVKSSGFIALISVFSLFLNGCYHPPYNNFREDKRALRDMSRGAGVGAGFGALAGALAGSTGVGAVIGGVAGTMAGYQKASKRTLLKELQNQDIQFVKYGDTMTLIVPTDRYFQFNSPRLDDRCYPGLANIIRLIKLYDCSPIYVAAFTDNVGSRHHKKMLSQAQAETMLTFLWANDIPAQRLHPEGYADKHTIGDNNLIHGSAYNRRIEIQWVTPASIAPKSKVFSILR
ncbi:MULTISPECIES: C-OmpA-like family protein CmpA [Legionella]|uniref:OmpA family protein n=1 Tax=Legionella septentrionalis TaxID=2498109 RepID=A0A3S0X056_9GAMM|nr:MULTISPECIES: C-OmpA-like family protein CmpA [Legionella]MCP0913744.1 C-OmpA-like family protein CmpA [Legionella sp. 27cVA30]RUQ85395.1 OmpA family protein [Legionella septentrionalis]RUQ99309.1 OmpA family protein [Legionella septentrionalis]RUR09638.1 OmpA family protein [Legionella septentrionalis]RUR14786.1 OmpA family protein [Legionella septentrionalis]